MWWQNEVASVAILMTCWGETPHIQAQVKSGTVNAGLNVFAGPDVVREGGLRRRLEERLRRVLLVVHAPLFRDGAEQRRWLRRL